MLHGMAQQGHAPKMFMKVSERGIPWVTVVVVMAAMLIVVYLNYLMPEKVFLVIALLATFATVWVWIMILLRIAAAWLSPTSVMPGRDASGWQRLSIDGRLGPASSRQGLVCAAIL